MIMVVSNAVFTLCFGLGVQWYVEENVLVSVSDNFWLDIIDHGVLQFQNLPFWHLILLLNMLFQLQVTVSFQYYFCLFTTAEIIFRVQNGSFVKSWGKSDRMKEISSDWNMNGILCMREPRMLSTLRGVILGRNWKGKEFKQSQQRKNCWSSSIHALTEKV